MKNITTKTTRAQMEVSPPQMLEYAVSCLILSEAGAEVKSYFSMRFFMNML
jgi:hypothetical protein